MSKQKQSEAGRLRHSITGKLNRRLFFRLLGIFITLNIIICIIAGLGLWFFSERRIANSVALLDSYDIPEYGAWSDLAGITLREIKDEFHNAEFSSQWPSPWLRLHDYWDDISYRGFRANGSGFEGALRSISYVVGIKRSGSIYEITLSVGSFIFPFVCCMFALFGFELLSLLSRTFRDRRMVRKTLDPIAELARTAQSLNEVNRQLDHEMTMALAGKLDGIDAGRLDMRIPVDDLQEELRNVAVAINGMLDRINSSYAAQARFVSDASHELRTPIAVIQGYANLLDRWGKEDEKALTESVAAIKDEAGNMKDLVEQLL